MGGVFGACNTGAKDLCLSLGCVFRVGARSVAFLDEKDTKRNDLHEYTAQIALQMNI
jgi:hypothetical protein